MASSGEPYRDDLDYLWRRDISRFPESCIRLFLDEECFVWHDGEQVRVRRSPGHMNHKPHVTLSGIVALLRDLIST